MNTQSITLDVSKKPAIMPTLRIGQGDKNGTTIEATIYDNGSPLSLSGYSVRFEMRLPDGTSYYQSPAGTISGNVATIPIDETYAGAVDGVTNIAYIVVYNGSVECSTSRINVIVLESAEEGADAAHAYSSGIIEATDAANAAAASATSAAGSATTAAANADAKAGLAASAATAANSAASTAGAAATAANTAAQAADTAREAIQDDLAAKADKYGYYPLLSADTSDALLSGDSTLATFARRVSDHDGACRIESLRGNTVVWNQLNNNAKLPITSNGVTMTAESNGVVDIDGTATANSNVNYRSIAVTVGHKYLFKGCPSGGGSSTYYHGYNGLLVDTGNGGIVTSDNKTMNLRFDFKSGQSFNHVKIIPQVFDLTQMFGAGNEPATVEEFERRFPDAYYPYNAGSLLSVNVEGVKAVGFNQWDEEWEVGSIDTNTGQNVSITGRIRTTNYIPVAPSTTYYMVVPIGTFPVFFYDENKNYIALNFGDVSGLFTTPANARYMRFRTGSNYGGTYNNDICLNVSDPERNGTYKPYRKVTREISASTYFPTGIKSAGTARDELRKDKAITRIGTVDLGTLTWSIAPIQGQQDTNRYYTPVVSDIVKGIAGSQVPNIVCSKYQAITVNSLIAANTGIAVNSAGNVTVYDDALKNVSTADFKNAMSGVMLYYELATPTETAIDPPLNMTYPVEQGGTESIVVPIGEMSAPPTLVTVYAYDADGIVDKSQSIVAPVEGARASANYSVGSYLVQSGTLYRVTTAIATGETITPGSNVTATTVMAEIIRLTA